MKTFNSHIDEAKIKAKKTPVSFGFGLGIRDNAKSYEIETGVVVVIDKFPVTNTSSFLANMKLLMKQGISHIGVGDGSLVPQDKGKFVMFFSKENFAKFK